MLKAKVYLIQFKTHNYFDLLTYTGVPLWEDFIPLQGHSEPCVSQVTGFQNQA